MKKKTPSGDTELTRFFRGYMYSLVIVHASIQINCGFKDFYVAY